MTLEAGGDGGTIFVRPVGDLTMKRSCRFRGEEDASDRVVRGPHPQAEGERRSGAAGFDWRLASSPWCASRWEGGQCN